MNWNVALLTIINNKAIAKNQDVSVKAMDFFNDVMKMDGYKEFSTGKTDSGVKFGDRTLKMDEAVSAYKAIKSLGGAKASTLRRRFQEL